MNEEVRAKAIQAVYEALAADAKADLGYISSLHRYDTSGDDWEIFTEDRPFGATVDCWVNIEGIVDTVAEVLRALQVEQSITQHPVNGGK